MTETMSGAASLHGHWVDDHTECGSGCAVAGATEVDERSTWHSLTSYERFRILPGVHDLWFVLTYYTGLRDRLRCPSCKAVGTWKMHGSLVERWIYKDIAVRRWLCKWCGHYIGPRGRTVAYLATESMVWALPEPGVEREATPAETLREAMGKAWPWKG